LQLTRFKTYIIEILLILIDLNSEFLLFLFLAVFTFSSRVHSSTFWVPNYNLQVINHWFIVLVAKWKCWIRNLLLLFQHFIILPENKKVL